MKRKTRILIRADGTEQPLDKAQTIEQIRQLIGATALDSVNLRDRFGHVMFVDDLGHDKQLPVNAKATELYHAICIPGTTHQIRGDVVVVPDLIT